MKRTASICSSVMSILLFAASTAHADTTTLVVNAEDVGDDAESIMLSVLLDWVDLSISVDVAADFVVRAVVEHDDQVSPRSRIDNIGSTSFIELYHGVGSTPEVRPRWDITLGSSELPIGVKIVGSTLGSNRGIDLGGTNLQSFELMTSASHLPDIDFSTPTNIPLSTMRIVMSASIVRVSNIGNTDFSEFEFVGSANLATFDFEGTYSDNQHRAKMSGSANMVEYRLPPDVGARVDVIAGPSLIIGSVWNDEWDREWHPNLSFTTRDYDECYARLDFEERQVASTIAIMRE